MIIQKVNQKIDTVFCKKLTQFSEIVKVLLFTVLYVNLIHLNSIESYRLSIICKIYNIRLSDVDPNII